VAPGIFSAASTPPVAVSIRSTTLVSATPFRSSLVAT
jgi:hypothetical protein